MMLCVDPADQRQIDRNLAELLATPVRDSAGNAAVAVRTA
jgi:hypothetical protein